MKIFERFKERVKAFKGRSTYGKGPVGLTHNRKAGSRPGFWDWAKRDKDKKRKDFKEDYINESSFFCNFSNFYKGTINYYESVKELRECLYIHKKMMSN